MRARLAKAVAHICPSWLADSRDDIIQKAILKVSAAALREGNTSPPASYLWKAAHSATIDEIRRARRRREDGLEEVAEEQLASPQASPAQRVEGRRIVEAIRACLGGLVRDRRLAVTLHLQGHSVPECARLLGWNAKRAENLVYRGMQGLRACLESTGFAP